VIDTSHPFYRRLWVRIAIPLICIGWALFETIFGSKSWAFFFWIIGSYSTYVLIIKYKESWDTLGTKWWDHPIFSWSSC